MAAIVVLATLIAVVGYFVASGKAGGSALDGVIVKTRAATIAQQASDIAGSFHAAYAKNTSTNWNTSFTGIFGRYGTLKAIPEPPAEAFAVKSPHDGFWFFRSGSFTQKNTAANTGSLDPAIFLTGLKEDVCKELNKLIPGAPAALPILGVTLEGFRPTATNAVTRANASINHSAVNLNSVGGNLPDAWTSGCAKTSDGYHVYFYILRAR